MTAIIGIEANGHVYVGGDSMVGNGWGEKGVTSLRKVFRTGEFLIGYTSSFRMGQILQHHLIVRSQEKGEPDERYMVVGFIEAVRNVLKEKGYAEVSDNREKGGEFLVGYRGRLYLADSDFQINHFSAGIAACGAGKNYSLGAALAMPNMKPHKRILRALEIAARLSSFVCPPFYVEKL